MTLTVLFVMGAILLVLNYQLRQRAMTAKITSPSSVDYLTLIKDLTMLKTNSPSAKLALQSHFMTFISELATRSLDKQHSGIGYFRLPNTTQVFVLSNKTAIQRLYARNNEKKFGQKQFFNRLAVILGQDNLMSSNLGSNTHGMIRSAILLRNESFRPQVAKVVADFFQEYEAQQKTQGKTLSEVMDKLSRRVLLATYFGQDIINPFETLYSSKLTKELIDCLFSLEPIRQEEEKNLFLLRNRIFELGCRLIFSTKAITSQLMQEQSWLNYLLTVRVIQNPEIKSQLEQLGITSSKLSAEQAELLLKYAIAHEDDSPLSALIRDVVNESLFIPLLGFDATATVLITALRIAVQDKRIYSIVKKEIQQKIAAGELFELHSPWDSHNFSYTEAVLLEALRLSPPAPIVPEIINETITLDIDGTFLTLPAGALVFIPMQSLHTHSFHFPDLTLSKEGQEALGKTTMSAKDIFPERWGPKDSNGNVYNSNFFTEEGILNRPGTLEKPGGLLSFKTGARRCPGLRIAMTEVLSLFRMLASYKFKLSGEELLELRFNYETPLQRNGGLGLLKISPRKKLTLDAPPLTRISDQEVHQQSGLTFFNEQPISTHKEQAELTNLQLG
ncbi:cytochrome P450 [Legionella maioricensis]|uniref:Cytochrome P450 n=1 Tax=Legionella maioricensis TaxID=2896528 RepID=A0A9X2IBL2_9GAMM|nr:cytochrome P450 [Legionella maioricensis]MCL9684351.1 cytochrome P450 [Legionella maioricensis]MCL9688779.1 cytochrome P450 [Legionella maioricensis]